MVLNYVFGRKISSWLPEEQCVQGRQLCLVVLTTVFNTRLYKQQIRFESLI